MIPYKLNVDETFAGHQLLLQDPLMQVILYSIFSQPLVAIQVYNIIV